MLSHPDYNNTQIENYYQVVFQTFMLESCVYGTCLFTIVYLEVNAKIQF